MGCRIVTIGATATKVCEEDYGRKMVVITPPTAVDSYWSFAGDSGVTTSTGAPITAGRSAFTYEETEGGAHKAIYAIVASGTATCRVEEIPN